MRSLKLAPLAQVDVRETYAQFASRSESLALRSEPPAVSVCPSPAGRAASSKVLPAGRSAPAAIDWLCRVFGFEVRLRVESGDGDIAHSELTLGDGLIMVGSTSRAAFRKSPRSQGGGNTQSLMVFVEDVEAHCAHARASGAKILTEPKTADYGEEFWSDRSYEAEDCEGHRWWFTQRLRSPSAPPPRTAKHP